METTRVVAGFSTVPPLTHRIQYLVRPLFVLGLLGGVSTADHFRLGLMVNDAQLRNVLVVSVPLCLVLLGWGLEWASQRCPFWRLLGLCGLGLVVMGLVFSWALQFVGRPARTWVALGQGLCVAACFVAPVLAMLRAAHQVRARPGSVVEVCERRAVWRPTLVAACFACLAAWPDWHGRSTTDSASHLPAVFGALGVGGLLLLALSDYRSLLRLRRLFWEQPSTAGSAAPIDVGVGEIPDASLPYRDRSRSTSSVVGDLVSGEALLRRLLTRSGLGVAAGGLLLVLTVLAPPPALLSVSQAELTNGPSILCEGPLSTYCTGYEATLTGNIARESPAGYLLELEEPLAVHSGYLPELGPAFRVKHVWLRTPEYCEGISRGSWPCLLQLGERLSVRGTLLRATRKADEATFVLAGGGERSLSKALPYPSWQLEPASRQLAGAGSGSRGSGAGCSR